MFEKELARKIDFSETNRKFHFYLKHNLTNWNKCPIQTTFIASSKSIWQQQKVFDAKHPLGKG